MPIKGVYCLCIENYKKQSIQIGALGNIDFHKGHYIYVGSALNSLTKRLERHIKTSQRKQHIIHWHIDYLLRERNVEIKSIYTIETDSHIECKIAEMINNYGIPIQHFGSSDCRCQSHLYYVNCIDFIEKIGMKKWIKDFPQLPE